MRTDKGFKPWKKKKEVIWQKIFTYKKVLRTRAGVWDWLLLEEQTNKDPGSQDFQYRKEMWK